MDEDLGNLGSSINQDGKNTHSDADMVFFRVAEESMWASTFLAGTSMTGVDFFAQQFAIITFATESATLILQDDVHVAPCLSLLQMSHTYIFVAFSKQCYSYLFQQVLKSG